MMNFNNDFKFESSTRLEPYIVKNILADLGIKHKQKPNHRNYLKIVCPFHSDKSFGNAGIDLNTGIISCFKCHNTGHIVKLLADRLGKSFKETLAHINESYLIGGTPSTYQPNGDEDVREKKEKNYKFKIDKKFVDIEFDPEEFTYTKSRGFTKEFCEKFGITRCLSGFYDEYYIIPIVDTKQQIYTFEARKLKQEETLINRYGSKSLKRATQHFKRELEISKIDEWSDTQDPELQYLLKPKCLYPVGSANKLTIWNIDNLDFNKDLYLSEGTGSTPKIYNYVSENCSCTFGSKLEESQIKVLKQFTSKIIIIPDNDDASCSMIEELKYLGNVFVVECEYEDKDQEFVEEIKKGRILEANEWLLRYILKKSNL